MPIEFNDNKVLIIDQLKLPDKFEKIEIKDYKNMFHAIKNMIIRGAPAIGIAGAFGCYLAAKQNESKTFILKACEELKNARPTAINLKWAIGQCEEIVRNADGEIKKLLLEKALEIQNDDIERCRKIGEHGNKLIKDGFNILTHCNAGSLATGNFGTALSPIYFAHKSGKKVHVFVDETRPYLQGARLTAWELSQEGVENTVITDNMAGYVMKKFNIDMVIIGADRIVSNGDIANKIGSYSLAILAKYHNIPFYVAAPLSTFDLSLKSGDEIPIEERPANEMRYFNGKKIINDISKIYNPAFDIVPKELITGYITENGVKNLTFFNNMI